MDHLVDNKECLFLLKNCLQSSYFVIEGLLNEDISAYICITVIEFLAL